VDESNLGVQMSAGRPSSYTPEIARRICEALIEGRSLRSICREEEWCPSITTVINWLAADKEFLAQYTQAREQQAELMADELIDIADDGTNDWVEREMRKGKTEILCDHEHINRSRLRVDTRKWVAARLLPKKYGDKVALTDPEGNAPVVKVLIETIGASSTTPAQAG
jgi:hypothetical protein